MAARGILRAQAKNGDFSMTGDTLTEAQRWGIAVIRVGVGVVFVAHGAQKLFDQSIPGVAGFFDQLGVPAPMAAATLVSLLEFFGGIALILGLLTRLVAIPLAIDMLTAILLVHLPNGFFADDNGIELPLLLAICCIGLVLAGSGQVALDQLISARYGARKGRGGAEPLRG
jgi:putative oxidoreductase